MLLPVPLDFDLVEHTGCNPPQQGGKLFYNVLDTKDVDQEEFEHWTLVLITVGIILALAEFLFVGVVVGKGSITGLQNGLLAGGGVVVVVVVLVWLATSVLKPSPRPDVVSTLEEPPSSGSSNSGQT